MDFLELNKIFDEADALINDKKIKEGKETLEALVAQNPGFGRAHNHLGWIYDTQYNDYANAEKYYRLAIQAEPGYKYTYNNYASVLSKLKRWDDLEKLLNSALKVTDIDLAKIYNRFGNMYEHTEKYEQAIAAFKNAAKNSWKLEDVDFYKKAVMRCKSKKEIDAL